MMVMEFEGVTPKIDENTYISESVDIIGKVEILENANIWFGTRLRGDMNNIVIGRNTNIQENSVVHVDSKSPCIILNNAKIGNNTIIGAGSLITQGKEFPEGVLILGNPAKVVRKLTQAEIENIQCSADNYVRLSKKYKK